jgi:hypothetical protein
MAKLDCSLIGRTVIPGPGGGHVGEFEDHCAFDRIFFELIKGTAASGFNGWP